VRLWETEKAGRATSERGRFLVEIDGEPTEAHAGESIAALFLRTGKRVFRRSRLQGEPRSMFCGMGVCHDCLVTVNGLGSVRACMTIVEPGMRIRTVLDDNRGGTLD